VVDLGSDRRWVEVAAMDAMYDVRIWQIETAYGKRGRLVPGALICRRPEIPPDAVGQRSDFGSDRAFLP
jgi:hypothetical protein